LKPNLVFDIGVHVGDDAAHYLHSGYNVVGVEANPFLAAQCARRFENEIRNGRMILINAGVLKEPGQFSFYRNLLDDSWSSFVPQRGKKKGEWETMSVLCVTTKQLIAEHGVPYFMKVDIEGADFQVLHTLVTAIAPAYISLELNCEDPIIESLIELGFNSFKFVDGETYWPTTPIFDHEIGWRILRKAGRLFPPIRSAIGDLPQRLRPKSEWNPVGRFSPGDYQFTSYSSGPFGEQAAGSWMPPSAALRWFDIFKENLRRARARDAMWFDVHARHSSTRQ